MRKEVGGQATEIAPIDIRILKYIVTQRCAFASEITREVAREERLWFSDVDASLERLIRAGLVEGQKSAYNIPGLLYSFTTAGLEF